MSGRNLVGAAWSAYLLLAYYTLTARKPARSPLAPRLFSLSQKVSERTFTRCAYTHSQTISK